MLGLVTTQRTEAANPSSCKAIFLSFVFAASLIFASLLLVPLRLCVAPTRFLSPPRPSTGRAPVATSTDRTRICASSAKWRDRTDCLVRASPAPHARPSPPCRRQMLASMCARRPRRRRYANKKTGKSSDASANELAYSALLSCLSRNSRSPLPLPPSRESRT